MTQHPSYSLPLTLIIRFMIKCRRSECTRIEPTRFQLMELKVSSKRCVSKAMCLEKENSDSILMISRIMNISMRILSPITDNCKNGSMMATTLTKEPSSKDSTNTSTFYNDLLLKEDHHLLFLKRVKTCLLTIKCR